MMTPASVYCTICGKNMRFEGVTPRAGFGDVVAWFFSCECGHSQMDEGDRNIQGLMIALAQRPRRERPSRNRPGKTGGEIAPAHIHFQLPVLAGQERPEDRRLFVVPLHRSDEQARAPAQRCPGTLS
jgi:hypothetical protein